MITEQGGGRILTAREVGEIFGVSTTRIYALAKSGILPCCRLGRKILFSSQQVEDFISGGGVSWEHGWRKGKAE